MEGLVEILKPGFHKANIDYESDQILSQNKAISGKDDWSTTLFFFLSCGRGVSCKWKPGFTVGLVETPSKLHFF